jgi:hypothetical protein
VSRRDKSKNATGTEKVRRRAFEDCPDLLQNESCGRLDEEQAGVIV